jgi:hypothetical protein
MDRKSVLGYSKNSPYKGQPYININTPQGLIDMSNTDIPLMGIDETGMTKVMMPYSGMHKFRGNKVKEIPMMAEGGFNKSKFYNLLFEDDNEITDDEENFR